MPDSLRYLEQLYVWLRKYFLSLKPGQKIDFTEVIAIIREALVGADENWREYFSTELAGIESLNGETASEDNIRTIQNILFGMYRQYASMKIVQNLSPSDIDRLAEFLPTVGNVLQKINSMESLTADEMDDADTLSKFGLVIFEADVPKLTENGLLALGLIKRGETSDNQQT